MELAEVGPGRQVSHDVSLIARRSASGPEENVTFDGQLGADGGGLCPARGPSGALQRLTLILSAGQISAHERTAGGSLIPDSQVIWSGSPPQALGRPIPPASGSCAEITARLTDSPITTE